MFAELSGRPQSAREKWFMLHGMMLMVQNSEEDECRDPLTGNTKVAKPVREYIPVTPGTLRLGHCETFARQGLTGCDMWVKENPTHVSMGQAWGMP